MRKLIWSFFEFLESFLIAALVVFLVRTYLVQPFLVSGSSMEPNFSDGNYLLVDELTYRFREPLRGEVIVFRYPKEPSSYFIKRIIGLPGEKLVIENNEIKIFKSEEVKVLKEPYLLKERKPINFEIALGEDEYFVMGDNRDFSYDSRSWGPLKRNDIIGLVRLRLWPLNQVMAFQAPVY